MKEVEIEVIERKARQLKEMIGLAMSIEDCESFVSCVISDYESAMNENGVHSE